MTTVEQYWQKKGLTCIYLSRTLLFSAPYADFYKKNNLLEKKL